MSAPDGRDRFNVKKRGRTEPDLWVRLYRLEFLSPPGTREPRRGDVLGDVPRPR